jgi:hypothetical protein
VYEIIATNTSKQLIFIDDSGDPGFKFNKGSSRYFVIALVIFEDKAEAEAASQGIRQFRHTLGWRDFREFKFNGNPANVKIAFLKEVQKYGFRIRAIVVDKMKISNNELKANNGLFYNYVIKEVLERCGDSICDAYIYLDGRSDRNYKRASVAYFRQNLNSGSHRMKEFRFVNSNNDNLIQLADIVAGSIYRSTQKEKTDCDDYLALIKKKIEDLWIY